MQIVVPRCGRVLLYNIQSRNPSISSSFVAYFRSTPTCFDKWEKKWNNSSDFKGPQPSKTYIKYKTRQKRADAKKALNDLFFKSGYSKFTLEGEFSKKRQGIEERWDGDPTGDRKKRDPLKSSAHRTSKPHQKRNKSKPKKGNLFEEFDDDHPGMHFQATYGNRWYSWSFKSWEESFSQSQTSRGFEWREDSNSSNRSKWRTASDDDDSDDANKSYYASIGSHSDRITLGLPTTGPLKIDQVKNAFRLSALKWHPDKHQGPSQAMAEEKFKVCATAYKSLCNALSMP